MNEFESHVPPYEGTRLTFVPVDAAETGQLELESFSPGPAGTSTVDLGQGVVVSVDFATPGRLCTIEAPVAAMNPRAGNVLTGLIGEDRTLAVLDLLGSGSDRPVSIGRQSPRPQDRSPRFASSLEDVSFGQTIAGFAVGVDRLEHPLVRATAFVSAVADLFEAEFFGPVAEAARLEAWLRQSAQVFARDASEDRLTDLLDPREYRRLAAAVSWIGREYGTGTDWAQLMLQSVPPGGRDADVADRAAVVAPPEPGVDSPVREQPDEQADERVVIVTESGCLRVDFPRRPSGRWVRVLDRESLALIALVPVANDGRRHFAEAVVPSSAVADSFEVETTDSPLPSSSTSSVDTMIEAVEAGRRATMLSARRDPSAGEHWKVCSGLWRQLGDETRAKVADAYAIDEEQVERTWQLHDSVREVIEG